MTGRFNQDLPENLQMAFEKAMNFKPWIITKQSINSRKIHEVNNIDIGQEDEIEINEAHVRNPIALTIHLIIIIIIPPQITDPPVNIVITIQDMDTANPTARKTSQCVCNTTRTSQQGSTI